MEFNFNDNQVVDSLDKVPEDFRGLYAENGEGKFSLNSEDSGVKSAIAAISRMNTALKASRAETKAAKGGKVDLSALADFGNTPEEILTSFNGRLEEAQAAAKASGNEDMARQVEKIKQDLAKAHSGDLEKRDKRIEALSGRLHDVLVKNEGMSELAAAGAINSKAAFKVIKDQIQVKEENGEFDVHVVDNAGDVRYSGVTGAPMTIKELVAEVKTSEEFGFMFKSEIKQGGGAPPTGQSQFQSRRAKGEMTANEKIAAGLAKGQHRRAG